MRIKLRLLTCFLLICTIIPVNLTFADPSIDRDGQGIQIDDIVYYLSQISQTDFPSNSQITSLLNQIVPIVTPIPTPVPNGGPGPAGYTFCANESGTCSFTGSASVAFGAEIGEEGNKVGYYSYRNFNSAASCNNETFGGDPIGGVEKSCYYLNIPNTMPPVLTLTGDPTVSLEYGASYSDWGATATDDFDGNLTENIVVTISNNINAETTLNTSVPGNYTYHYNVSDEAGNHAVEITRTVVVAEETSSPNPELNLAIGAIASAPNTYDSYSAAKINDGSRDTTVGGDYSWTNEDVASLEHPQYVQLDWETNKTFSRVDLYTSAGYVIRDYQIQYWNGSSWVDLIAAVTGNTLVHRIHAFTAVIGSKIRVVGFRGPAGQPEYVRVNEVEVY